MLLVHVATYALCLRANVLAVDSTGVSPRHIHPRYGPNLAGALFEVFVFLQCEELSAVGVTHNAVIFQVGIHMLLRVATDLNPICTSHGRLGDRHPDLIHRSDPCGTTAGAIIAGTAVRHSGREYLFQTFNLAALSSGQELIFSSRPRVKKMRQQVFHPQDKEGVG